MLWCTSLFIEVIKTYIFYFKILDRKKQRELMPLLLVCEGVLFFLYLLLKCNGISSDSLILLVGGMTIGLIAYADSKRNSLAMIVPLYLFLCIFDIVIVRVFCFLFSYDIQTLAQHKLLKLSLESINMHLLFIISFLKQKFYRNAIPTLRFNKNEFAIMLLTLLSCVFLIAPVQFFGTTDKYRYWGSIGFSIGILLFLLLSLIHMIRMNRERHDREKISLYEEMLTVQNHYYTTMIQHYLETRRFRHDCKKHLFVLTKLVQDNKNAETRAYIDKLNIMAEKMSVKYETGNYMVNGIMEDLFGTGTIAVEWMGALPEMAMDEQDIFSLFVHLLNHAKDVTTIFNQQNDTVSGRIRVKVLIKNEAVIIRLKHPIYVSRRKKSQQADTAKESHNNEMWKIMVREIVEKYEGYYDYQVNDRKEALIEIIFLNLIIDF